MKKNARAWCLIGLLAAVTGASQTIEQCRERYGRYFNHKQRLSKYVRFSHDAIHIDAGVKLTLYSDELAAAKRILKSGTPEAQKKLMAKGHARLDSSLKFIDAGRSIHVATDTARKLAGLRIAIDPGHFGNTPQDAAIERKYLKFLRAGSPDTLKLYESNLTFATASILAARLKEQGAEVMVTRTGPGLTSFGCTYRQWLAQHRHRVLDSLVAAGAMKPEQRHHLMQMNAASFYNAFFRDHELRNRALVINAYVPDATVIIHYNVDEKNAPWQSTTRKNYTMAFIPGAFGPDDLSRPEKMRQFLRWLLTDDFEDSRRLSGLTVKRFSEVLGIPIARASDAFYLRDNCMYAGVPGVFCRNLVLCRLVNSPLVYGESLYQDNQSECEGLMRCDEDIYGVRTSARIGHVAACYYDALAEYFSEKIRR